MKEIEEAFRLAFNFKDKSTRKQFWTFAIAYYIGLFLIYSVSKFIGISSLTSLYMLVCFIPYLAIFSRRMNDVNKSPLMILLLFVPVIGWIWLLLLLLRKSDQTEELLKLPVEEEMAKLLFGMESSFDYRKINFSGFSINRFAIEREDDAFQKNRNYKIYDTNTKELVFYTKEKDKQGLDKFWQYTSFSKSTAGVVDVFNIENQHLFSLMKTGGKQFSVLYIMDIKGNVIAYFDSGDRISSKFSVFNKEKKELFYIENKISSIYTYSFKTKKGSLLSIAKEKTLENFEGKSSSSSTFYLNLNQNIPSESVLRPIILSATLYCEMI